MANPPGIPNDAELTVKSIEAGDIQRLKTSGGSAPGPDRISTLGFQDVGRSVLASTTQGPAEHIDYDINTKGLGKVRTNMLRVARASHGMRDNATALTVLLDNPAPEPTFGIGEMEAAVYGATPPAVVGVYPDIDRVALFAQACTYPIPLSEVVQYTATTVVLANPAPLPDENGRGGLYITDFIETAHSPWYRAEVTAISSDRRTLTVFGWFRKGSHTPATPAGTTGCYLNANNKPFATNFVMEAQPGVFQRTGAVCEFGLVNNRGPLNYNGSMPQGVKAEADHDNFFFGIDGVNNGSHHGAFSFRARGQWWRGYTSRDNEDCGFVVEKGFSGNTRHGFKTEQDGGSFLPFVVAPADDIRWQVDNNGNIQAGSKTTPTLNNYLAFTNGNAHPTYRFTVGLGNGAHRFTASVNHTAFRHEFLTGDESVQFAVGAGYGANTHLEAIGSTGSAYVRATSSAADANVGVVPKGNGVLSLDYTGANLVASVPSAFTPERMIKVNSPVGPLYIPCMGGMW